MAYEGITSLNKSKVSKPKKGTQKIRSWKLNYLSKISEEGNYRGTTLDFDNWLRVVLDNSATVWPK